MKHIIITLLLLAMTPCLTVAQKKELSQARTYIKSRNKKYTQAEQLMTNLLKDSANRDNKDIYQVLLEAVKGQYDQANERMYLKQKQDTAAFFALAQRMFTIAFTLDTLDMRPDKKGRIKPSYRQRYASMLNNYRANIYNGGTFFVRKNKWKEAYQFMHTYLDCIRQPLFEQYNIEKTDTHLPEAAYWATYSGYRQHDAELTLRYHQRALQDTAHTSFTMQFIAEAYHWEDNNKQYIATLEKGFDNNPTFPYFFPRLMDYYTSNHQYEKALALADKALEACDTCELFLFAKSSVLLRLERWEESISYSRMAMEQNDTLPEPYFNASLAYVNMADKLDANADKEKYVEYYQRARTYMEYYRLLMPREEEKWAPVLYRIYLNLNLGKQFDEIDKILKNIRKK
ncbi:MAG: hypothetical protein K5683_03445 [Prevotella sp.]|nr:hypothetical protein [Prevotella sp.]